MTEEEMKHSEVQLPSNRKFGAFCAFVFLAAAGYFLWKGMVQLSVAMGVVGAIFTLVIITKDELLLPLNKLWMRLGLLMGAIVSPIVLGALFFFLFAPIAFIMRLSGRDELRIKKRNSKSYWRLRDPAGPSGDSFKNQF